MKEILKHWCETGQLSIEQASLLISEYLSYDGRNITSEQLMMLLQIGQSMVPINWDLIMNTVARKNNCEIVTVQSVPDIRGNRTIAFRKLYETN